MWKVETAQVPQFDPFELLPDPLARIEFGRIGWQALQVNPPRRAIRQELLDPLTPMNRGAVPNDDHAAGHLAHKMFEKCDDICGVDGPFLAVEVHLTCRGDGSDGRQVVMGVPLPQEGGLTDRGIRTHDTGQGRTPGFIYKEARLLLRFSPFLIAGHVSVRQRAIAASSRWRARRIGCCGLQRIALQRRPIWVGG